MVTFLYYGRILLMLGCVVVAAVYWQSSSSFGASFPRIDELTPFHKMSRLIRNVRKVGQYERGVSNNEKELVFALTLCKGPRQVMVHQVHHSDRQLKQMAVLLKSAAVLTAARLRFIVVADSRELFDQAVTLLDDWPEKYQSRVTIQYVPGWYPGHLEEMRNSFRPCATQRIFLPSMLPEEDALIYLDTDIIFMTPPEQLWTQFSQFNSKQLAALPPILKSLPELGVPYFNLTGHSGLNTGVILMNLTRIKAFPGEGWVEECVRIFQKYKYKIGYGDQDIINQLFIKYPDLLFESNCELDYQVDYCREGIHYCPEALQNGARLVHGNTGAFVMNHQWKMRALFESWHEYRMGSSLTDLYHTIRDKLQEVTKEKKESECSKIEEIDVALSQQLLYHIETTNI